MRRKPSPSSKAASSPFGIPSWRNAKKKETDELPVIQAISLEKRRNRSIPLKRFILGGQLSVSTFFRYEHRAAPGQPLWGPRGKPRAVTMEDEVILQLLKKQQKHGKRQRLCAVSVVHAKHPEYSARHFQELANELRNRLRRGERNSMLSVEYCEAHLIWSMDIFEQIHRGVRFHVLQVIDLGSRMKLEPAVKGEAFTGEEVAEHLNYLMHKHEAPLFLKRDNGSNLNSGEVLSILKMFSVIPFNSPPGFPQFNGVMERSQGEIKRYLHAILKNKEELDSFTVAVHLSVERANRRRRAVLAGKCAWECWDEEFPHFTRRERESVYLEIKRLAEGILEAFPRKKRLRKDAGAHAWRIAIQRYLESKEYIRLFRDGRVLH